MAMTLLGCPLRRVDFGKDGAPTSVDDLFKRISFAEKQIFSLKGEGRLGVDSPQGKGSITLFAAVTHPSLVHLEQLDFFGRPQGVFVTDGERFGLYDAQAGKFYRGPASARNLGRFLPVVMPPRELAAVMLGRAPRLPDAKTEMRFDDELQLFVVTLTRGNVKQTLHVLPPSYRVVKSTAENLAAYDLDFGDVANFGTVSLPKTVVLDAKQVKTRLELNWKDVAVNESPDLTLFDLEPPADVPVVEVDENGDPRQPLPQ
ncbi:MAG: DUF4292 domain-containing protein [Myxococcaceae bacterium]